MTTNQVKFEGYFKKEDIQQLLDGNLTQVYITGTLNRDAANPGWTEIKATGYNGGYSGTTATATTTATAATATADASKTGCPKPC